MHKYSINKTILQGGLWSALLVLVMMITGCGEQEAEPRVSDPNTTPTQVSINLISQESKDGTRTYKMVTPLMEYYELADEPFTEFTQGIQIETFNDSTAVIESDLIADYARSDEQKELWVARGNVVANNFSGNRTLYTEELWWDQKAKKIYSDVAVRVREGNSNHVGVGFEADEEFVRWSFKRPRGQMEVKRDTTKKATTKPDSLDVASVDTTKVVETTPSTIQRPQSPIAGTPPADPRNPNAPKPVLRLDTINGSELPDIPSR